MGSNETSPPRSVLSGEAWHKVRSNLLKAALLDSEPVFPVIPQMELFLNVKGRNQIYFLSFCWPLLYQTGINALCNNISWSRLGAQAIPLENLACSTEGHSIQILSIATLPLKKKSSVLQIMHWLTCYLWSLIATFFGVPQVGEQISGPASRFEAPGPLCPWHPPRPFLRAKALQPRRGRRMLPSGAAWNLRRFPGAVGRCGFRQTTAQRPRPPDDESCGHLSSAPVQPTNQR